MKTHKIREVLDSRINLIIQFPQFAWRLATAFQDCIHCVYMESEPDWAFAFQIKVINHALLNYITMKEATRLRAACKDLENGGGGSRVGRQRAYCWKPSGVA